MDRPGMEKLLADLRAGLVERIVVWRLDRLGRTTRGLCQLFDEWGGPRALDSFWVKLRCALLVGISGPRHPKSVARPLNRQLASFAS
jgi:hypothetical protein